MRQKTLVFQFCLDHSITKWTLFVFHLRFFVRGLRGLRFSHFCRILPVPFPENTGTVLRPSVGGEKSFCTHFSAVMQAAFLTPAFISPFFILRGSVHIHTLPVKRRLLSLSLSLHARLTSSCWVTDARICLRTFQSVFSKNNIFPRASSCFVAVQRSADLSTRSSKEWPQEIVKEKKYACLSETPFLRILQASTCMRIFLQREKWESSFETLNVCLLRRIGIPC